MYLAFCRSDLTGGFRASARMVSSTEQGLRQGLDLAGRAGSSMVPALKKAAPTARDALESGLQKRAALNYAEPTLREVVGATRTVVQRARMVIGAAGAAAAARSLGQQALGRLGRPPVHGTAADAAQNEAGE
jgi:hypothetical protein